MNEKYAPCRFFRKGDEVRVVEERAGRIPPVCGDIEPGGVYIVADDEAGGDVMLDVNGSFHCIEWIWLELVTPVEAVEPYVTLENILMSCIEVRNCRTNKVEAAFYYGEGHAYTFKSAADASCTERDRLNEEWRKDQNHE